jgi:hypothetical protein
MDLTPQGILSQIDAHNREAVALGKPMFPRLSLSGIKYYRSNLYKHLVREKQRQGEEPGNRGALGLQERLRLLRIAAEVLIPHLGSANSRGEFTANERFESLMKTIDAMQRRQETSASDLTRITKSMSPEALRALIGLLRGEKLA